MGGAMSSAVGEGLPGPAGRLRGVGEEQDGGEAKEALAGASCRGSAPRRRGIRSAAWCSAAPRHPRRAAQERHGLVPRAGLARTSCTKPWLGSSSIR